MATVTRAVFPPNPGRLELSDWLENASPTRFIVDIGFEQPREQTDGPFRRALARIPL